MALLALDIGGTTIKHALFTEAGERITAVQETPTEKTAADNHIAAQAGTIYQAYHHSGITGVAIASAGVVDPDTGTIVSAGYTIPGYTGTPLKQSVENSTGVPCWVENDVNCALLGELWRNHYPQQHIFCMTIGTGIGGAILINGQLYRGASFGAGEVGYVNQNGQDFQTYANTQALIHRAADAANQPFTTGYQIVHAFRDGNPDVQNAVQLWLDGIASELVNINHLLNPELFIIGGGIIEGAPEFGQLLDAAFRQRLTAQQYAATALKTATLGNEAGMYGALYHYLQKEAAHGHGHSQDDRAHV